MIEKQYETKSLVITWRPSLCEHAGRCVQGLPAVFNVKRKPWIILENGTDEKIKEVINQCPSGALRYVEK